MKELKLFLAFLPVLALASCGQKPVEEEVFPAEEDNVVVPVNEDGTPKSGLDLVKAATLEDWATPTGAYEVIADDQLLENHTVFYPADLSKFPKKDKLPVLVMSGPGCDATSSAFRPFFTEVASHGYLLIVSGPLTEETVYTNLLPKNTADDMVTAIDWAFAENEREGSIFFGKVDPQVCPMGQSCGTVEAYSIRKDPRITQFCLFNGGGLSRNSETYPIADFQVPVAMFVGGEDKARAGAQAAFETIENVPAVYAVRDIPGDAHAGTFRYKNGGAFARGCVAWLDWQMKGDENAAKMFKGEAPSITKDPRWIEFKKVNIE